jgi:hypothetical protein
LLLTWCLHACSAAFAGLGSAETGLQIGGSAILPEDGGSSRTGRMICSAWDEVTGGDGQDKVQAAAKGTGQPTGADGKGFEVGGPAWSEAHGSSRQKGYGACGFE